ncbi:Na/Pi symporter, partial [Pirellulaceae bacterium]|nr:Na/Pi symporter [Pirellulaceae bacterium]
MFIAELDNPSKLLLGGIATGMGGGLALFLFGMRQMTESLKTVAGSSMKSLLAKLTANRFTAALAGTIVTAVIQSSSVTTVLIVGFISAGLLTLSQSIGVIIGANIGTTITAQIIAFQVYKYGLLMIAVGFLTDIMAKSSKTKQWGMVLMGLGLIFFGMELMSNAAGPLRAWPPFIDAMQNMNNPMLAIFIGAVFTAIIQSSSAATGVVIVLASQGMISLETGIGLCFGTNIGTC